MKWLREPLVHFIIIGIAIYALYGVFAEPAPVEDDKTIVLSAGELEWMQASWRQRWNRAPTAAELDNLIQQYIRETVLYREALTMGLNQHDQVIRRRLAQKLEFLAKDLVTLTPATDAELLAYFDANRERYTQAPLYTFTQVFIDPDKRGDTTLDDAARIKAQLIELGDGFENAGAFGDEFMLQDYYPDKDAIEIQKLFGSGFTETLVNLAPGQWHGPVLSGYGTHLVYLSHVTEPAPAAFDEVRERVLADWTLERGEELNQQFYNSLREQYHIVIEDTAVPVNEAVVPDTAR